MAAAAAATTHEAPFEHREITATPGELFEDHYECMEEVGRADDQTMCQPNMQSKPRDNLAADDAINADIDDSITTSPSVVDSMTSRPGDCETGHERLIAKQPSTDVTCVSHSRASRPPHYLHLSILVMVLCNLPFGCVAVLFSLMSIKRSKQGEFQEAETKGNIAKWFSIIGIAITVVVVAFVVIYFVYIDKNIVDTLDELPGLLSEK